MKKNYKPTEPENMYLSLLSSPVYAIVKIVFHKDKKETFTKVFTKDEENVITKIFQIRQENVGKIKEALLPYEYYGETLYEEAVVLVLEKILRKTNKKKK